MAVDAWRYSSGSGSGLESGVWWFLKRRREKEGTMGAWWILAVMIVFLGGGNSRHGLEHVLVQTIQLLHLHPLHAHLLDELGEDPGVALDCRPLHTDDTLSLSLFDSFSTQRVPTEKCKNKKSSTTSIFQQLRLKRCVGRTEIWLPTREGAAYTIWRAGGGELVRSAQAALPRLCPPLVFPPRPRGKKKFFFFFGVESISRFRDYTFYHLWSVGPSFLTFFNSLQRWRATRRHRAPVRLCNNASLLNT